MANGRVVTGFSKPYVAKYTASGTNVTYTGARPLARGVDVDVSAEVGDDNNFFADNVMAESAPGLFTGGSMTMTVDGLKADAEAMILGLPEPESVNAGSGTVDVYSYGDSMQIPYVGVGFIVRYQSDNMVSYVPVVMTKARFATPGMTAATQEEEIDWQTQSLEATLMRDDTANHNWKKVAAEQTTEAAAEAILVALLGGSTF